MSETRSTTARPETSGAQFTVSEISHQPEVWREAAANVDRLYPQLLPSEGTCCIGGNLAMRHTTTPATAATR